MASTMSGASEPADSSSMHLLPYPLPPMERDDMEALRSTDWGSQEGSVDGLEEAADAASDPAAASSAAAAPEVKVRLIALVKPRPLLVSAVDQGASPACCEGCSTWSVHLLCCTSLLSKGCGVPHGCIISANLTCAGHVPGFCCRTDRHAAVLQMQAPSAMAAGLGGFELLFTDLADGVKGASTAVAAGVLGVQAWLSSGMQLLIKVR
jgi:hypothetical protein